MDQKILDLVKEQEKKKDVLNSLIKDDDENNYEKRYNEVSAELEKLKEQSKKDQLLYATELER